MLGHRLGGWRMTYVLIAIVGLYYVLLVRSHVRPYLLLRVKGDHMKYLPMAALLVTLPLTVWLPR
jgi:predicted MFS family arabinose efflux permease